MSGGTSRAKNRHLIPKDMATSQIRDHLIMLIVVTEAQDQGL
jgi:hypothetical protein